MNSLILLRDFISRILDLAGILAGFLVGVIGFIVTWGVISRYFFIPSYWVEPYSIYLFVASSFLGASYAMKKGEHVSVDILTSAFPPTVRKVVDLFTSIIALIFFIYLTWRSMLMVSHSYQNGTKDLSILEIHLWIPQSFVPLGSLLLCLSLIWHMINVLLRTEKANPSENNIH